MHVSGHGHAHIHTVQKHVRHTFCKTGQHNKHKNTRHMHTQTHQHKDDCAFVEVVLVPLERSVRWEHESV